MSKLLRTFWLVSLLFFVGGLVAGIIAVSQIDVAFSN